MRVLIAALSLITSSAFACPNLAGNYKFCRSTTGNSAGTEDMVVSQATQNRVMTYTVSATTSDTHERQTEIYIADNKVRVQKFEEPSSGIVFEIAQKSFCEPDALNIHIDIKMNGESAGWSKVRVTKVGNQQMIASTYRNGDEEHSDIEVCE